MAIPEDTIRQVREANDILEVVSEYVSLKKRGGANYFGVCPFHQEKTPSFSVNPDRQIFHCFGCGKGGNVFTFLMEIERIEFPDAVRRLAERVGIAIKEGGRKVTGKNEALYQANERAFKLFRYLLTETDGELVSYCRKYLRDRGIDAELEAKFELGLSPEGWETLVKLAQKRGFTGEQLEQAGLAIRSSRGGWYDRFRGRLMFPIRNAGKRVVGFGGRVLKDDPERPAPKYINSPETPIYHKGSVLYGLPQARDEMRNTREAILVEGYTDLIALHMVGLGNAVASLGTALTREQAGLIKRFADKATLLYDGDEAGVNAAFRGADVLISAGLDVLIALLPDGEDPDTLAQSGGRESVETVLNQAQPLIDFKVNYFFKRGMLDTPQGKAESARAIVETLRAIPDVIVREAYLHDAAEKLGVDEQLLGRELHRSQQKGGRGRSINPETDQQTVSGVEEGIRSLLWLVIRQPQRRAEVFSNIRAADFGEHPLRPVFEALEAAHVEGVKVQEADMYDALNGNASLVPILNEILNRDMQVEPDTADKIVEFAALYIERAALKKEQETLRDALRKGGSPELLKRHQYIMKRLREIEQIRRS